MYHFLVWGLLQPFPLFMLALGVGIVLLWRRRRETRRRLLLVTVAYLALLVFSLPAFAYLLGGSLEWSYPAVRERPSDVQAIVILSSGERYADGDRLRDELDEEGLNRCLEGAALYRQGRPCPIVVSGGNVVPSEPHPACAAAMRDFLVQLGVRPSDVIVEDQARDTYENAVNSARILKERGLERVALVTDAIHLPRAVRCFRKQGVDVVPCGCRYGSTPHSDSRFDFVPSVGALVGTQRVWHEWLGWAWYWLRGRL